MSADYDRPAAQAGSSSPLSAEHPGSSHPQDRQSEPGDRHAGHPSQALVVHPLTSHKSSSPESEHDSTIAAHSKSGSPPSAKSHPQALTEFATPISSSSKSAEQGGHGNDQVVKSESDSQIKPKDLGGSALGESLYGQVKLAKVGNRTKLIKHTPTKAMLEDVRADVARREGDPTQEVEHIKHEVKPKSEDWKVTPPLGKEKKRKNREADKEDGSKVELKIAKKEGARIEAVTNNPPSAIAEQSDDIVEDEDEGSDADFNPLSEVSFTRLEPPADNRLRSSTMESIWKRSGPRCRSRWLRSFSASRTPIGTILADSQRGRTASSSRGDCAKQRRRRAYVDNSFREAYHAVHMYFKMSEAHQKELRKGIEDIMKEEGSQSIFRNLHARVGTVDAQ
jgi:hypothetical protein